MDYSKVNERRRAVNFFDPPEKYLPVMLVALGKKAPGRKLLPRAMRRNFDRACEIR